MPLSDEPAPKLTCPRCGYIPPTSRRVAEWQDVIPLATRLLLYIAHLNEHWALGEAVGASR